MGAIAVPRAVARVLNGRDARPPGFRQRPERIVLPVRPGLAASDQPPVRIFVGTEREQDRAERVFIFSIEQVRDPARVYEIYLMKEIADFDRSRWLTGFTNYRFAIPHWAGASGRAIYNDVDQIYLGDPAEMFDLDMDGHGFLSITARDTSVMLIDCAKMAAIWPLDAVQHERRKRIEERARAVPDLWGPLARAWNARDEEYVAGRSKVLHYTTIHTQPWQPFPYRFVYQHNAVGYVWTDLERAADRAHFQVFNAERPSAQYEARVEQLRAETNAGARRATATAEPEGLKMLLAAAGAATVLDVRLGLGGEPDAHIAARGRTVTRFDPAVTPFAGLAEQGVDAVVCAAGLPYLPIEDTPWVVASLFRAARRCVYVRVRAGGHDAPIDANALPGTWRELTWWEAQMAAAGARYPDVRWKLVVHHSGAFGRLVTTVREGGRRTDGQPPAVWVLADDKAGHTTQSAGLAEALGWPYEVKKLQGRDERLPRVGERAVAPFQGSGECQRPQELRVRRMVEERGQQRVEIRASRVLRGDRPFFLDARNDGIHVMGPARSSATA